MKVTSFKLQFLLLLMLLGCTNDFERDMVYNDNCNELSFVTTLANIEGSLTAGGVSRASGPHYISHEEDWNLTMSSNSRVTPTLSLEGSAGVLGYVYSGTWSSSISTWDYVNNVEFEFSGDELNSAGDPKFWSRVTDSGKDSLRVYAYAPKELGNIQSGGSSPIGKNPNGEPTLTFAANPNVALQYDLITAKSKSVVNDFCKSVDLPFTHALTAIRFKAGFDCVVKSVSVLGIFNSGNYTLGGEWSLFSTTKDYIIDFGPTGKSVEKGDMITDNTTTLMLIPQELPANAKIKLVYNDGSGDKEIYADISNLEWKQGKMITYTLYSASLMNYIYFDLAAGDVTINASGYTGYIFVGGNSTPRKVSGVHASNNFYYVYQSSTKESSLYSYKNTGWLGGTIGTGECSLPTYNPITYKEQLWSDYVTDNTVVEDVIVGWSKAVKSSGRDSTSNRIQVSGTLDCNMTIDNLFSRYQVASASRSYGGITYVPTRYATTPSKFTLTLVGDNRFGNIHYTNPSDNGSEIIFEGTGSLTVADVDYKINKSDSYRGADGYYSNHWASVIGGDDGSNTEEAYGIVINSGVIYAGSTAAENCTAIGGGGNGDTRVEIHGGVVTAVATTTGTAIGGGIGFQNTGGVGNVIITGGNIYAYNFANTWDIPSAAIGGAGSSAGAGSAGNVTISGGNIYALSAIGTAIGGGSSKTNNGGNATVTISGGSVIAKSITARGGAKGGKPGVLLPAGAGIGGGTGGSNSGVNGGSATINISGTPIIRTGSIGGGKTNNSTGKIGTATVVIGGGDIQAQFVMAKGAIKAPSFKMNGGLIRNSHTDDSEYYHLQPNGGALYMDFGECVINGGVIRNCSGKNGGAIYICGEVGTTLFKMTNGTIENCVASGDGGAICLEGGEILLNGGEITENLANGGNGGAISIRNGNFDMIGNAVINANSSIYNSTQALGGNGGGVFITSATSTVRANIESGTIMYNSSDRNGGGVCVDMEGNDNDAIVTVGDYNGGILNSINPNISHNFTVFSGGGLYVSGLNAHVTINNGKIFDNSTVAYVDNSDVANEYGMVTLLNGNVDNKVVTFNGNGGFYTKDAVDYTTAEQKIVTATNSTLIPPVSFIQVGYDFIGWNTRSDGNGTEYTAGQLMNINQDIELFAQWQIR